MSLCKFVGAVTKYSQKYLHALFIVFATNDEAHKISTRIPEFRRSGGGENAHEKVLTDGEEAVRPVILHHTRKVKNPEWQNFQGR